MSRGTWVSYDFAILRVVPHVHLGMYVNAGVLVHARTVEFLGCRLETDRATLAKWLPDMDPDRLTRYLSVIASVVDGDPEGGPIVLLSPSERFHWLTAHRSDVLQTSPIHEGICRDPRRAMDELFTMFVARGDPRGAT